jgi:hypothetical protein
LKEVKDIKLMKKIKIKSETSEESESNDHTYNPYSFARLEKAVFKTSLKDMAAVKETSNAITKLQSIL